MRKLSVAVLVLSLMALMLVPLSGDAALTTKETTSMDQSAAGGETTTFSWFIYNRYDEPVFISADVVFDDPMESVRSYNLQIIMDEDQTAHDTYGVVLQPNQGARFDIMVELKEVALASQVGVDMVLTADVGVDDANLTEMTLSSTLEVTPLYHLSDSYNRIMGVYPNVLPEPLDGPWGAFLVSMGIWVFLAGIFMWGLVPAIGQRILNRDQMYFPQLKYLLNGPFFYLMMTYGFFSSIFILGPDFYTALILDTISRLIYIGLLTWIVWDIYKLFVQWVMERFVDDDGLIDQSLSPLLIWLGKIVIAIAFFGAVLDVFGLDLMVFLAGAGIIGIALAIGAQDTFSNFFAGFFLLLERPFRVGDLIMMEDGVVCEVMRVGLRSTTLYNTWSPQYFVMPNRQIADSKITNVMRPDPMYWVKIDVGVAYGSDVELVKKILMDVVMAHPETLKDDEHMPWSRFMEFGDSSLKFRVTAWVADFNDHYRIASELREAIHREFRKNGVEIPFPQRDVWFRNNPS